MNISNGYTTFALMWLASKFLWQIFMKIGKLKELRPKFTFTGKQVKSVKGLYNKTIKGFGCTIDLTLVELNSGNGQ